MVDGGGFISDLFLLRTEMRDRGRTEDSATDAELAG
jgi:hypothetical protein